jgi:hypothetical protein
MSTADDILFAPIHVEEWRISCQEIVRYLRDKDLSHYGKVLDTLNYPPSALTLEKFIELYHKGQQFFWEAGSPRTGCRYIMGKYKFTGEFGIDDEGFAYYMIENDQGNKMWRSIQDSQLYPNDYNDHHLFATDVEAAHYTTQSP